MNRIHTLEGFVLKKTTLLNEDVSVIIFSKQEGKILLIAKGAKTFKSQRAAHLQTGNLVKVLSRHHKSNRYIEKSELISAFSKVRTGEKMDIVYLYFFILDRLLGLDQQENTLFKFTIGFLTDLSASTQNLDSLFARYLFYMLHTLGYADKVEPIEILLSRAEEVIEEKLPMRGIM